MNLFTFRSFWAKPTQIIYADYFSLPIYVFFFKLNPMHCHKPALISFMAEAPFVILTWFVRLCLKSILVCRILELIRHHMSKLAIFFFLAIAMLLKVFTIWFRLLDISVEKITFLIWKTTVAIHPKSAHFLVTQMVGSFIFDSLIKSYKSPCTQIINKVTILCICFFCIFDSLFLISLSLSIIFIDFPIITWIPVVWSTSPASIVIILVKFAHFFVNVLIVFIIKTSYN